MRRSIFLFMILILATSAFSAEIKLKGEKFDYKAISIDGEIGKGDLEKIKQKSYEFIMSGIEERKEPGRYSRSLTFELNTPGGDVLESIRIGHFFRDILASVEVYGTIIFDPSTEIGKDAMDNKSESFRFVYRHENISDENIKRLYSSGVLIFYGAVERFLTDNADMRFVPARRIPVVGLHRPSYEKGYFSKLTPGKASSAYADLEITVRNYLKEMGATQEIIDRMFSTGSGKIDLILSEDFKAHFKERESFFEEWLISNCGVENGDNHWKVYKCEKKMVYSHQDKWAMEYKKEHKL